MKTDKENLKLLKLAFPNAVEMVESYKESVDRKLGDVPDLPYDRPLDTIHPKTEKSFAGYHRPVCNKCHCELRPETNGVGVLDMADWGPAELYDADLWKCPSCGIEVVGGFGHSAIASHFESEFKNVVEGYRKKGLIIENKEYRE
jgi:hypothetical protein